MQSSVASIILGPANACFIPCLDENLGISSTECSQLTGPAPELILLQKYLFAHLRFDIFAGVQCTLITSQAREWPRVQQC